MEFRILGPLEVEGVPSLGGPKQRALLAQLVLAAGEPVPASRLVDEVWGEQPPAGAQRSVEVYVSRLRQEIASTGAEIMRRGSGYELVLGSARVDLREFRSLAREGRESLAAGDPKTAHARLQEALALWRGPALADIDGRSGVELDEERLAAAEDLADAELSLGRHGELVPVLERRAREEPLRERTRAQLMLALYRSGRQADALAAYRVARDALDALGLEPGEKLRELERAILRQEASLAVEAPERRERRKLPTPTTSLVGRRREIDEVAELLRGSARLVTLTGPGGIGKTRLALAAAHVLGGTFGDGVWFVGLAPLADPSLVGSSIATALELRDAPLEQHLAERELLLLLDNFEHVLDAAPLVSELLSAAPRLKVLATSRSRLDLYGEQEIPVPPLAGDEAVALFVERAQAARHGFALGAGVDSLCERFDRLPLALELVAARAREWTLPELLDSAGLDLAAGGPRDLPERQRTLRAAIAWSEERLTPAARELFAALGAFAGGFEREAVEAVSPGSRDALAALVDASIVRRGEDARLRLLATVREYALERLDVTGGRDIVRRRHLEHYAELAGDLAPQLLGSGDAAAHAILLRERDNLRAALAFAREQGLVEHLLRLVRDLSRFWYVHGSQAEGAVWAEAALSAEGAPPPLLRAQALKGAALLDWRRDELELAQRRAEEALSVIEALGEERELLGALSVLGATAYSRKDLTAAAARFRQGAELARRLGESSYLSIALSNLAGIRYEERDWAQAGRVYAESLAVARELGSTELAGFAVYGLGAAELHGGALEEARVHLTTGLALFAELGFSQRMASCCNYLAGAAHAAGDELDAARLLGAAAGLRIDATSVERVELEITSATHVEVEAALGARGFTAAYAEGEAAPEDVVARALAGR